MWEKYNQKIKKKFSENGIKISKEYREKNLNRKIAVNPGGMKKNGLRSPLLEIT